MPSIRHAGAQLAAALLIAAVTAPLTAAQSPADAPPAAAPAPIPAEAFFGPPQIQDAKLSPNGRWLAMTTGLDGGRVGLFVFDLEDWKPLALAARYADADIDAFHWVNDERLVYSVADHRSGGADQPFWPGLRVVERDGTSPRTLVRFDDAFITTAIRRGGREPLESNHRLLHVPGRGDDVVVGEWVFGPGGFERVIAKRLDTRTGRATSVSAGVPDHAWHWLFDPAGEPRVVVTRHKGRGAVHWRAAGAGAWQRLAEYDALDPPWAPHSVDPQGQLLVTHVDPGTGVAVLKRFDFAAGRPEDTALVSTPGFDVRGEVVSETPGSRMLGIRVLTDAETTVWFHPALKALQAEADRRLPGRVNHITCRRCGEPDMSAIVVSQSDRHPGEVWHVRAADGRWRKVGDRRPAIDPARMAQVDFERYRARDGLEIPVWVTRPVGADGRPLAGPLPTVVLVHGGPWLRGGSWGWHAEAQFLASRGYLVVEPEFRGSDGYGRTLFRAGLRQWGRAMQDDLVDALAWAAQRGWADADRACIAGASYGGYATLMGLIRHPETWRCGVAWVAVTDPRLLYRWSYGTDVNDEGRGYSYRQLIGDPEADRAMLEEVTPVLHAARLRTPLMLAFGARDARVPIEHGRRIRQALLDAGRPPAEYVVYEDEGHGWYRLETRLDFARRLERFLAAQLAPPRQ